jgi:TetR/AcrR family transcriptional regulator, transcriptional repressor for nem operon
MYRTDTRERIMSSIAVGMHESGFQGLRTDKIIEALGITKGAFYHYFSDKPSVALAVIDEIHTKNYVETWQGLITADGRVLEKLAQKLEFIKTTVTNENVHLGCPVNNLIQEMSPLDEEFRHKLETIVGEELRLIAEALAHGQEIGEVRGDINPDDEALFIMNGIEGTYSTSKLFRSKDMFDKGVGHIIRRLETLAA